MKSLHERSTKGKIIIILIILITVVSCTAGPNQMKQIANEDGKTANFFSGLWHGFISLFTFIGSIFSDKINIYEVHNMGGWYNFGFLIGISAFFGGSGGASGRAYKKRKREEE